MTGLLAVGIYAFVRMAQQQCFMTFDRERLASFPAIIGVDEAGRGPLAGPVVAAAVCLRVEDYSALEREEAWRAFNDSKKLSKATREQLMEQLLEWEKQERLRMGIGQGSVAMIAELNILGATRAAMQEAIEKIGSHGKEALILVDGRPLKPFPYAHTAIVKGDGLSLAIAMASVVAKVTRDRLMAELDRRYPLYGFAKHKGYGTQSHRAAIREHGSCAEHRALFLRKL